MATHELTMPVPEATVRTLAIGDIVYLSGIVHTARDMAHIEISKLLAEGKPLPENLDGGAIFHAGPVALKEGDGWRLNVIGPTTSIRMESYADMIAGLGVRLIIGKGGMGERSRDVFKERGQAYLQAAPGCAVQIAAGVRGINAAHWLHYGMPEAMWVLDVQRFGPFIVTMDAAGGSRYDEVKATALQAIKTLGYCDAGSLQSG